MVCHSATFILLVLFSVKHTDHFGFIYCADGGSRTHNFNHHWHQITKSAKVLFYWRFRKTSIPNLFVTVVDFSPARTYCCFPDKYGSTQPSSTFLSLSCLIFVLPYLAVRSHITISLVFTCTPACIALT